MFIVLSIQIDRYSSPTTSETQPFNAIVTQVGGVRSTNDGEDGSHGSKANFAGGKFHDFVQGRDREGYLLYNIA